MSLKSSNKTDTNLYTLEVEISAEDFEAAQSKAFAKQKNRISLPGFRKGKVTRKMAENFYGKGFLYEDALDICYPDAVEGAIKEAGLEVVGTKSADIKSIGAEGVELAVEVFVKPEIELKAYKELKATRKKVEATDEEVKAKLDELVERNARIVSVEDRAVKDGDITVIDFEGFVDGVAFEGGKAEEYELTIGSGAFIPGFEEQIIGHNSGDDFDVNVTFPEQYAPELAGKDAVFKIKLHEIKEKQLPEIDDEFAQDAADCDTVDDLKKSIVDEIKKQKEADNDREIRTQLFEKLAENDVAEIPEVMVENELDNQIKDIDYRLSSQGIGFDNYLKYMGMTVEQYREQARPDAEKQVKIRLALEKIVELEGIEVSDEDVDKEYEKFASQYQMELDQIKRIIPADGLKKDMAIDKAIEFVRENAKVTTARKPRAAKEKADETADEAAESAE